MSRRTIGLPDDVGDYVRRWGLREPPELMRLREATADYPHGSMQIAPEQGAVLAMLVGLLDARRCLEIGTFTGYSSLAMALALPEEGTIVCCDLSHESTSVARRFWAEAGVERKVDLRLAPAVETLDGLLSDGAAASFDLAFIDADKESYPVYWERCVELVRPGGMIVLDNVLWRGDVARPEVDDPATRTMRAVNERIATDPRVDHVLLAIADGMTLARKR